jgi:integrase
MQVAEKQKKRKKGGAGRAGDGVKYLGVRHGVKWWQARLVWIDPYSLKRKDTKETFEADSKTAAIEQRKTFLREKLGQSIQTRKRFDKAVDEWLDTLESFGTRKGHKNRFGRLPKTWGPKWIDEIPTQEIQAYLGNLRRNDGKPYAKGILNGHRDGLVSLWDWAQRKGYVSKNAARETLREKGGRTQADARAENAGEKDRSLTSEQAVELILWFEENEPELYPLVLAQFVLGARFGEASALRLDCLDLQTGIATIAWSQTYGRVGPTKGKRRRIAGLSPTAHAFDVIRAHVARMAVLKWPGHDVLVFPSEPSTSPRKIGNHWGYTRVRLAYKAAFEALGFDMANATHCARHTTSNLASQEAVGAQLSESLVRKVIGHTTAQVAASYRHPEHAEVIQLAAVVERRLFRSKQLEASTGHESGL